MFHCNGWCFPWAVTAVAATPRDDPQGRPGAVWELIDERGRDPLQRRADGAADRSSTTRRAHRVERPVTVAGRPPRRRRRRCSPRMSELNFRVVHVYGLTETYGPITVCPEQPDVGRAARRASRRGCSPARARRTHRPTSCASSTRTMQRRPARRRDDGRGVMRGNIVMARLLRRPRGDRRRRSAAAGSTPATSRCGTRTATSSCATAPRTSSSPAARTSRRIEVEQAIVAHPAVLECAVVAVPHEHWGERPKAFVTLSEGATATRRRSSPSAASASPTSSAPTPSSSARCRRPRPARCRSSCCASASGPVRDTRVGAA